MIPLRMYTRSLGDNSPGISLQSNNAYSSYAYIYNPSGPAVSKYPRMDPNLVYGCTWCKVHVNSLTVLGAAVGKLSVGTDIIYDTFASQTWFLLYLFCVFSIDFVPNLLPASQSVLPEAWLASFPFWLVMLHLIFLDITGCYKAYYRDLSGKGSANERRRKIVTSAHIDWAHTQNDPCNFFFY